MAEKRGPRRPPREAAKPETTEKVTKDQESTKKSAAAFAKFFKTSKPATMKEASGSNSAGPGADGPIDLRTDFDKTFQPFVVKKYVQMAPQNWFLQKQRDIIVIDEASDAPMNDITCSECESTSLFMAFGIN